MNPVVHEPARSVPVVYECDLCVIGGSCTGVFAAVRAARLGATVALVENNAFFGGVATAGLVSIWHSLWDTEDKIKIISGLTEEVIDRLQSRNDISLHRGSSHSYANLNTAALILELDRLVCEHPSIRPFLHTRFVSPVMGSDKQIDAIIIEDKTGRRAIRAKHYIDASGDGDLLDRAGFASRKLPDLQPPTVCALIRGIEDVRKANPGFNLAKAVHDLQYPEALKIGLLWSAQTPGDPNCEMVAGTRAHGADCSDADQLTAAEIECRRQVRAMVDILRKYYAGGECVAPVAIPTYIGIRETRHANCLYQLTQKDVLEGVRFDDAIANGSYCVDVHHSERAGLTFRYLDGREVYNEPGKPAVPGRWREPIEEDPTFYQIPFRSLIPEEARNLLVAGRLMDADRGAYGAIRVMVNCNQTGEAAGTAAALATHARCEMREIPAGDIRSNLSEHGSIIF